MIDENTVEFFNTKLNIDLSNVKNLTNSQQDRVRHYGSQAEALLKNKDLAMFIHHYKFEILDNLANIRGYTEQDNMQRVALANELSGIDNFVNSLKRAVYWKNRIGKIQDIPDTPTI